MPLVKAAKASPQSKILLFKYWIYIVWEHAHEYYYVCYLFALRIVFALFFLFCFV